MPEKGWMEPPHTAAGLPGAGEERRRALTLIAYHLIAEKGLEGLRVRAIAARAEINIATLHYYFPTKEDLIRSVVAYLIQEFSVSHVPQTRSSTPTPLEQVCMEFADMQYRLLEQPEMMVVLIELRARAARDAAIAQLLAKMMASWKGWLVTLLTNGVEQGDFRPDLDIALTATAIMTIHMGFAYQATRPASENDVKRLIAQFTTQVEQWIMRR